MVNSKRGRMSSSDREKIHAMAERGMAAKEIAAEVERRVDVVEAILGLKKAKPRGRKPKMVETPRSRAAGSAPSSTPQAAPDSQPVSNAISVKRSESPKSTLEHQLWVRPGFQIQLTLPGDLSQAEAERLSVMVRNLPFSE